MDLSINSLCILFKEVPRHLPLVCNDGENVSIFEDGSGDQSGERADCSRQDQLPLQRHSTVQVSVSVTVLGVRDVTECRFLQGTLRSEHSRT